MVNKDKKVLINEGRQITNGKFVYGGFPRILSEEGRGATDAFKDDNLGDVATKPNESEEYKKLYSAYEAAGKAERMAQMNIAGTNVKHSPEAVKAHKDAMAARLAAQAAMESHPYHKTFMKAAAEEFENVRGARGLGN